jgi:hypothetical protein
MEETRGPTEKRSKYCNTTHKCIRGRRGRDRMDLQLPMKSVPITTDVVSSNLNQGEMYNNM